MALDTKEKDNIQKERRSFLKKTTYAVPTLIILGQLARPTTANATVSEFTPPPGPGFKQ